MSSTTKCCRKNSCEDDSDSSTIITTKTTTRGVECKGQKRESSYSDCLEPAREVPTIAEPLTPPEEIALRKWKEKLSETRHFYEAVFVLGPMCAGKTSTIHEFGCLKQHKHFAYVDTDEIMTRLDGYTDADIDVYYPSARNVSIHLTDWLLEERMSFIAEGTCVKYLELRDYMIRLKERGYNIRVVRIDGAPLDVLLDRASKRVRRRVPLEVIRDIHTHSIVGLQKLWEINAAEGLFEEYVPRNKGLVGAGEGDGDT